VLANVHGVLPYFYVPAPPNFQEKDCEKVRQSVHVLPLPMSLLNCHDAQLQWRCGCLRDGDAPQEFLSHAVTSQGRVDVYCLEVRVVHKVSIRGYDRHPYRCLCQIDIFKCLSLSTALLVITLLSSS
jgi:hypothetical protein